MSGRPRAGPLAPGAELCRCMGVGAAEVRRVIRRGARTLEEVGRACAAGTGCRSCHGDIEQLLDRQRRADLERAGQLALPGLE